MEILIVCVLHNLRVSQKMSHIAFIYIKFNDYKLY